MRGERCCQDTLSPPNTHTLMLLTPLRYWGRRRQGGHSLPPGPRLPQIMPLTVPSWGWKRPAAKGTLVWGVSLERGPHRCPPSVEDSRDEEKALNMHTLTRVHMGAHTPALSLPLSRAQTLTHQHTHAHTFANGFTPACSVTCTHQYTHVHTHSCSIMLTLTSTHTTAHFPHKVHTYQHILAHVCKHLHICAHASAHSCLLSLTHTCICAYCTPH